jgi:hypothetical protein
VGKTWARGAFHAVVSLVYTWPLVYWLQDGLPNGTETPGTVAYFNLWTLRWNQQQIGDLYRHYWDAPIFHPVPGAFALSEPQPLTGLVFAPIAWISHSPVLAYNLVLLLALTLNGLAAARLARRVGARPWPAALAGAVAQFLPFVSNELGVLQLVMVFPVLYTVDAILAWSEKEGDGGLRRALAIGAWLTATFFTCGYYGLFTVTVVAPAALLLVRRDWFRRERLLQLAAAGLLFAVTAGPLLIAQNHYTAEYTRPTSLISGNSATPASFIRLDETVQGSQRTPWLNHEGGERLYPGTLLVVTGLVGAVVLAVRRRWRPLVFLVGIAVLGGLLAMGLRLSVFGWQPYELVRERLPGYKDLRSPFRAGVYVQLAFVPLAAAALDALWGIGGRRVRAPAEQSAEAEVAGAVEADRPVERDAVATSPAPVSVFAMGVEALSPDAGGYTTGAPGPSAGPDEDAAGRAEPPLGQDGHPPADPPSSRVPAWLGPALACILVVVGLAEVHPGEQALAAAPRTGADVDWITWLAEHHETPVGDGSVAMVPFPANGNYVSFEPTTVWMLAALEHGHPLVNGYSGFFPRSYDQVAETVKKVFPSDDAVRELAGHGVTWVVMDRNTVTALDPQIMPAWADVLRPRFEGADAIVYELHGEAL